MMNNFCLAKIGNFIIQNEFITPSGNTVILANDQLLVLAENELSLGNVYQTLGIPKPETEDEDQ